MPQEQLTPEELARQVALSVASEPSEVGEFLGQSPLEGSVSEFRFASKIKGYEGWLWSVTLFHDTQENRWTVDESSLIPGSDSLLPPKWVSWKDRLLPSDLSVTDAMGTESDDSRLEVGYRSPESTDKVLETNVSREDSEASGSSDESPENQDGAIFKLADQSQADEAENNSEADDAWIHTSQDDLESTVEEYALSRRHVLSPLGRAETAKRWYEGQHGPKSLSTRTADGKTCESCGFMIPLQGELGTMFAVCANRWSPDDGRVVSLDHGCGEHSEIEPPQLSNLWVQSKPAFDDLHIDVVQQSAREEVPGVELIEQITNESSDPVSQESQPLRTRRRTRSIRKDR
ncbi:hypothetical protein KIMH_10280 [Bombiscardovia apis]|uniref:DUF3027 domain-containing protein n=1 Tax=Bombiscardovia apis TaxID=2932182 RepID=A0ABM8BDD3_9BIFI|nr:DUF3027 domain-containing protein [Bombiscardovia apis]BDR54917.1 hypothetical protein KIMH_10280 [Bombiscardovia apis]